MRNWTFAMELLLIRAVVAWNWKQVLICSKQLLRSDVLISLCLPEQMPSIKWGLPEKAGPGFQISKLFAQRTPRFGSKFLCYCIAIQGSSASSVGKPLSSTAPMKQRVRTSCLLISVVDKWFIWTVCFEVFLVGLPHWIAHKIIARGIPKAVVSKSFFRSMTLHKQ